jgi:hypothetical protein
VLDHALTIIDLDGGVTVTRLAIDFELDVRVGDLIADGEAGHWHVEEIEIERRRLVVSLVEARPAITLVDLLAA